MQTLLSRHAFGALLLIASLAVATAASAAGQWTQIGKMSKIRYGHTLTALTDGRVVAIGGFDDYNPISVAEILDPAGANWVKAGELANPRFRHTATRLPDGRVLIIGGRNNTNAIAAAEVFNPADGSFAPAGNLATPRYDHAAVGLPDGRVFVFGGNTDQTQVGVDENEVPIFANPSLDSVELWDPATATFVPAGKLAVDRAQLRAALLSDGRILVAGGRGNVPESGPNEAESVTRWSTEIYDPNQQGSSPTSPMSVNRVEFTLVAVPGGAAGPERVIAAGGYNEGQELNATAESYDPSTGAWTPTGSLSEPRVRAIGMPLPDGTVVLIGGQGEQGTLASTEILGADNNWVKSAQLVQGRDRAAGAMLPDGRIIVSGGFTTGDFLGLGGGLDTAELWSPD